MGAGRNIGKYFQYRAISFSNGIHVMNRHFHTDGKYLIPIYRISVIRNFHSCNIDKCIYKFVTIGFKTPAKMVNFIKQHVRRFMPKQSIKNRR